MTAATLTMAGLLLVTGQAQADTLHTNQRNHRIPIEIHPSRRQEIKQLLLFASSDQGRNWQQVAVVNPDKDAFVFYAPGDGLYWFRVAAVNRQGKQEPPDMSGPPDQKMVIDTVKPLVRLVSAQRNGEDVAIAWEIQETHADLSSFQVEYQVKENGSAPWTAVPVTPQLVGRASFRVPVQNPLLLRVLIKDLAGNKSFATAEVQTGNGIRLTADTTPANPPGEPVLPPPIPPKASDPAPLLPTKPVAEPSGLTMPPPLDTTPKPPVASGNPPAMPPPAPLPSPPPFANNPAPVGSVPMNPRAVATTETPLTPPPAVAPTPPIAQRRPLPPLLFVNSNEVVVEYELAKVGPSGIGSIDLWWTRDDGQSWERYAVEPDLKGVTPGQRLQRTIENLPGDSVYGFCLVVKSKAGRGKAPPTPGDIPDIRIEVDTKAPMAQLYAPEPDPQRPGALLLTWNAQDKNLTATPITLEWAEQQKGPWQPIVSSIPNTTGKHSWQLPPNLPVAVYLRLRVKDLAGNEGVAVTAEPQVVDLSEPEGRIVNLSVPPRRP